MVADSARGHLALAQPCHHSQGRFWGWSLLCPHHPAAFTPGEVAPAPGGVAGTRTQLLLEAAAGARGLQVGPQEGRGCLHRPKRWGGSCCGDPAQVMARRHWS